MRLILLAAVCAGIAAALWWKPVAVQRIHRGRIREDIWSRLRRVRPSRPAIEPQVSAVTALAAELRAGSAPNRAIAVVAQGVWPRTSAVASWGGDVITALRDEDDRIASHLAACWQVGMTMGAPLADIIENLARAERDAADARVELRSSLAGPQATARMLALLPVLGIGLGYLLGADPITWFVTDPLGPPMLIVGALLTIAGFLWTRRIAGQVEAAL